MRAIFPVQNREIPSAYGPAPNLQRRERRAVALAAYGQDDRIVTGLASWGTDGNGISSSSNLIDCALRETPHIDAGIG